MKIKWKYNKKMEKMPLEEVTERIKMVMSLPTYEKIKTIPYVGSEETVSYETNELIARCPQTGIVDFYTLKITYIPKEKLPELKALKRYIMQFEEIPISHEHLADKIYKDFLKVVEPKELHLRLEVNIRGGIKTVIER